MIIDLTKIERLLCDYFSADTKRDFNLALEGFTYHSELTSALDYDAFIDFKNELFLKSKISLTNITSIKPDSIELQLVFMLKDHPSDQPFANRVKSSVKVQLVERNISNISIEYDKTADAYPALAKIISDIIASSGLIQNAS